MKYTKEQVQEFIEANRDELDFVLCSIPVEDRTEQELYSTAIQFMCLLDLQTDLGNTDS